MSIFEYVYYHHPGGKQFSLDFVHPDAAEIVSQIFGYDDDFAVKVHKYDIEEDLYARANLVALPRGENL